MEDRIKNIIETIETLESRINSYWNFYILVVVASIGWLMSSSRPFTINQGIALTVALGVFFLANLSVLGAATKRVVAFEDELNCLSRQGDFVSGRLKTELSRPSIRYRLVATFILHGVIDLAVIYAIWSKLA